MRRRKGPRLWLQPARRDKVTGQIVESAVWHILDAGTKRSTGCGEGKIDEAEKFLARYLASKLTPRIRDRDPATVKIADVVAIYTEDVAAKHVRPAEIGRAHV